MNDPHELSDEQLDALLASCQQPIGADAFRHELFRQTARELRRRRWQRRAAVAASLAACYLAGVLTVGWPASKPTEDVPAMVQAKPEASPIPTPPETELALAAPVLERLAEIAERGQRARLYLVAGRRYEEANDIRSAVRCYYNFCDWGTAQERAISPEDDSWLLMTVKADKLKENPNEPVNE
jgi:sugar phosphate isomerase/epimerase